MSLRTVWEKWNKDYSIIKTGPLSICTHNFLNSYGDYTVSLYISSTVDVIEKKMQLRNPDTISINTTGLSNPSYRNLDGFYISHTTLFTLDDIWYGGLWECSANSATGESGGYRINAILENTCACEIAEIKGTTSYGFLSSASASAYPDNNVSGSYWYVKSGQDTIDPAAITYGTPQGGQLLDISITPTIGKVYGGNVSYKYEISLDGGTTWSVANESTTAETISVLVPYGSESFTARVTASDDLGFTSVDAVTGETFTVNNNAAPVITCEVTDLGIVEAGFTVPYSVSDADGDDITVDVKLDGTKIQGETLGGGVLKAV